VIKSTSPHMHHPERSHTVCALNGGSSSLKFALYQFLEEAECLLARGEAEEIGTSRSRLWIRDSAGAPVLDDRRHMPDHATAIREILGELNDKGYPPLAAIGHRIVNGGPACSKPQKITPKLLARLRELIPLAPLHLPTEIQLIESIRSAMPRTPQVACFDTAFHRGMPEIAQRFPLPRKLWSEGVRRYGFHGLSYEYVLQELGSSASKQRVIIAHLGSGASLVAVQNGVSLDTSMGLTPTGGVMMGTRTGDLDPGVLLYLLREKRYDSAALEQLVDHESGLLGVSATTADMKTLLDRRGADRRAREAVEMFCNSVRKQIGAFATVLGGVGLLVFTGGIGERAPAVRAEICRGLEHIGIRLDPARNRAQKSTISRLRSPCSVRVVPTNEELMIARHTRSVVFARRMKTAQR
jgi:acetate kinase